MTQSPDDLLAPTAPKGVKPRVAVLIHGMLRDFTATAPSFNRHVVTANGAKVLYFGPAESDQPDQRHKGNFNLLGSMTDNPKSRVDATSPVDADALGSAYGTSLVKTQFHQVTQQEFAMKAAEMVPAREHLFNLNPTRMFSMFFNMQGVARLLTAYEEETGECFDRVIITRPDLAFYSPITVNYCGADEVHIGDGEGFSAWGEKNVGNAPVYYYKNLDTGDFISGGRRNRFNDQLFLLNRKDLVYFTSLYDDFVGYMNIRVPASPETVMYLHLIKRAKLKLCTHPEWEYEIHRKGAASIRNVIDSPEIVHIDRRNLAAQELLRRRPVASAWRDLRTVYRHWKWRLFR